MKTINKAPYELEGGWTPWFPKEILMYKAVYIHPSASDFHLSMNKADKYAAECVKLAVDYNKTHQAHQFKVGDQVLVFLKTYLAPKN
jgi:elongation factor P hydroxylase